MSYHHHHHYHYTFLSHSYIFSFIISFHHKQGSNLAIIPGVLSVIDHIFYLINAKIFV
ncbi:hypothetical protein EDC01DRAFT_677879 [Geopyxis carbonaria]|nr:hypothetical protein EDC01DRAFT_677879 [Geopyxis carbonaria]